jgi:hypothetical protein
MAEKCSKCQQEKGGLIRARREFKNYAGDSKYIYISVCSLCLSFLDPQGLEVLDDGEPIELERSTWREDPPQPVFGAPVKGRQMTIEEALQMKLF